MEEGVILSLHDEHHGGVSGWGIHGAKGHDSVAMLRTIRANKGELFLISLMDSNLMEASFAVKTNEVQSAMGVAKVVKGIVAAGNGVFEWAGNGVEGAVVDAKFQMKSVMSWMCSWWGLGARMILELQGPPQG